MEACIMCNNAKIDPNLTDDTDYSACGVGVCLPEHRFMITSGCRKPLAIEFEIWNDGLKQWQKYGVYNPKFCPECGRKIIEFK